MVERNRQLMLASYQCQPCKHEPSLCEPRLIVDGHKALDIANAKVVQWATIPCQCHQRAIASGSPGQGSTSHCSRTCSDHLSPAGASRADRVGKWQPMAAHGNAWQPMASPDKNLAGTTWRLESLYTFGGKKWLIIANHH